VTFLPKVALFAEEFVDVLVFVVEFVVLIIFAGMN
jgi:hypothetical protein